MMALRRVCRCYLDVVVTSTTAASHPRPRRGVLPRRRLRSSSNSNSNRHSSSSALPNVVVTSRAFPETLSLLSSAPANVIANDGTEPWPRAILAENMAKASAMVAFMPDHVDGPFLEGCPHLRIVACALKGYDNFDIKACTDRNVWVTYVPDLLTEPTAELAVGLMIGAGRNVVGGHDLVRSGAFEGWRPILYGRGLHGSTVGICGFGALGRAIRERLRGFGPRVVRWFDPAEDCGDDVRSDSDDDACCRRVSTLEEIWECDYVVMAAPLNASSFHQVDAAALARMDGRTVLVNIGRGSTVDEAAVADALHRGTLGSYAADVFEFEDWALAAVAGAEERRESSHSPPAAAAVASAARLGVTPALLAAPRTLFTPHLGSAVEEVRRKVEMSAARTVVQCLRGEVPDNALNLVESMNSIH